jgi:CRP-like cAMP-binding protein
VDLLELPYFDGISMDGLVSLVDLMRPALYEPGTMVVRQGDTGPQPLYIATAGKLLITKRAPDGQDRALAELESPTLFGEIELFCQIPPVCTARAATRVEAYALSRQTFDQLFESRNPALLRFTFNVARVACHRLAIADELLAQVLSDEDLIKMRRTVWDRMAADADLMRTTGAFKRPVTR